MIRRKSMIAGLVGMAVLVAGPALATDDFKPVTIEWLLAQGSEEDAAFAGGPQTRYNGECGEGLIQRDTYLPNKPEHVELINSLGPTLDRGEDWQIPKTWEFVPQVPCGDEPTEEPTPEPTEPPVVVPPTVPETPVAPPVTPSAPEASPEAPKPATVVPKAAAPAAPVVAQPTFTG